MTQRSTDEPIDDQPIYNMRAVAQQTGLPAATLRAWERRYGFPAPQRTPNGYRLYSSHDIQRLRWLKSQIDNGMAISQAITLLNSRREAGQDPAGAAPVRRSAAPLPQGPQSLDDLAARLYAAVARFDHAAGEDLLNLALATHPIEDVCLHLFEPLMARIGASWEADTLSVQAEHFATNLLRERVITLAHAAPAPHRRERVLAACAPGEWHELGLLVSVLFLRRAGFAVTHLGQNVPVERIVETTREIKPAALLLAASTLAAAPGVLDIAEALAVADVPPAERPRLLYGGRIFNVLPELHASIPGVFAGYDAAQVVETVEQLASLPAPHPQPAPPEIAAAVSALRRNQSAIIAGAIHNLLQGAYNAYFREENVYAQVQSAGEDVTHALIAALRFGRPQVLAEPARWARAMLPAHGVPDAMLIEHVRAYGQALAANLPAGEARIALQYFDALQSAMNGTAAAGRPT